MKNFHWKSWKTTHLCLQTPVTPEQASGGPKERSESPCSLDCSILPCSLVHPSCSNVVVYKIRSHHNHSVSDETDDVKRTVTGLDTHLDVWKGIDRTERAFTGRKIQVESYLGCEPNQNANFGEWTTKTLYTF